MRALLAASVAVGALAAAHGAWAQTKVSGGNPVQTKTVNNGNPGDIEVSGSLSMKSGTAVTLNSNNSVTVDSGASITMNPAQNGSTAILVEGGNTGSVTNNGQITVSDGTTRKDSVNGDGILDGAWATGENLCGICVAGAGVFTGNITNSTTGVITVLGNDSYGIMVGALPTGQTTLASDGTVQSSTGGPADTLTGMVGNLSVAGSIGVTGDNSYGVITTAPITGNVTIDGTVTATGAGSVGVALDGSVSGRVVFGGTVTSTGYSSTTAPTISSAYNKVLQTPSDIQIGGPAVVIGGNMANGVLFDEQPTLSTTVTDVDGDGVADANQSNSVITTYGSMPAIQIGSTTQAVTLGVVGTTNAAFTAQYNYGLIIKGTVTADGIYGNQPAAGQSTGGTINTIAVELGTDTTNPAAANMPVTIDGGIRITGTITSLAIDSSATGLQLDNLASTPTLDNEGTIAVTSQEVQTKDQQTAIAVLLKPGSSMSSITNSGTINADMVSLYGTATAIADESGTLTDVENRGLITATVSDPNAPPSDEVQGAAIAVDARANTTNFTFHQFQVNATDTAPSTVGAILLGNGNNTVDIEAGSVTGSIYFGANNTDQFTINNGATVAGAIIQTGGGLSINLANGTLTDLWNQTQALTNLNVGAKSTLVVTIDPSANSGAGAGGFLVSGNATLATGASLGVRFTSLLPSSALVTPVEYDLISVTNPANLTAGTLNLDSVKTNIPFLYTASAGVNTTNGTVFVDVSRKTSAMLGMNAAEASTYNAFYNVLSNDQQLETAFLNQTTKNGFFNLYDQMLPDHSGAPLLSLASGVDAVSKALNDRRPMAPVGETTGWAQEINFVADKTENQAFGFHSSGFGMASGLETGTPVGAFGTSLAFTSSSMKDSNSVAVDSNEDLSANMVELGFYWRETGPHLRTWARAGGGYAWFNSTRDLINTGATLFRQADSTWSGYSFDAAAGISYEMDLGRWFIRPEANTEYFYLKENSRTETGGAEPACSATITTDCGGDAFDLAIGPREGHYFTATGLLNVGGKFGVDQWLQPEIHLGWTQYISVDPGVTRAYFVNNPADPFNLYADTLNGGGPVIGFRLLANGAAGFIALEGDADLMKMYKRYQLMIRAGYRF
jgi:hypothetical protein